MTTKQAQTGGLLNRRTFLKATSLALGSSALAQHRLIEGWAEAAPVKSANSLTAADLPRGSALKPVSLPHFPDRLHAFVWRNWQLVPARRMGEVVGASARAIVRLGIRNVQSGTRGASEFSGGVDQIRAITLPLIA